MTGAALYAEHHGQGNPVVCLHGWGMHSGIFESVAAALQDRHQLVLVDLPGHGNSQPIHDFASLDVLANTIKSFIETSVTAPVTLLAWSLSGLIGQWLAIHAPELINKLVLVAGTPCFANRPDWQHGIDADVLQQFANGLETDYPRTRDRFLGLQFMGADDQKIHLRQARELMQRKPAPDLETLRQGLALLSSTDLRHEMRHIQTPLLILSGERDKLVPTPAVRLLAEQARHGQAVIFKGCGHAPFLSHSTQFIHQLKQFFNE